MKLVYGKSGVVDNLEIYTVQSSMPFYGRELDVSISVYHFGSLISQNQRSAISFGVRPKARGDISVATIDGFLRITEPNRSLEQKIEVPGIYGNILNQSELFGSGVPGGRSVCNALFRKFESVFETCRRYMLSKISSSVKGACIKRLDQIYTKRSEVAIRDFLKNINWPFMFPESFVDKEAIGVIDYTLLNNNLKFHTLHAPLDTDIPIIQNKSEAAVAGSFADMKAEILLEQVIGAEEMLKYRRFGHVEVNTFGYKFQIAPNKWIVCYDPNGKQAKLCIHTVGLSCNPIDEISIAFLHLSHEETFMDFMKTAIYHGVETGFQKPIDFSVAVA